MIPKQLNRQSILGLVGMATALGAFSLAPSASGYCGAVIADPPPPGFHSLYCQHAEGPKETWTVPAKITKPEFTLRGADDAVGGSGGFIRVRMPVVSSETLELDLGGDGAASSVKRKGEPLLIAGGGNGDKPNYISSEAKVIETRKPGGPIGTWPGTGSVFIQWYDRRDPIASPRADIVVDIFDGKKVGFPHTGAGQSWIVPDGVEQAIFELWGGRGESSESYGHVLAGYEVTPGERFGIWVGGSGEDTTLYDGDGWPAVLAMAAGGNSERPNYVFPPASPAEAFWEGGGVGSQPGDGYAIVHFWPSQDEDVLKPPRPKPPTNRPRRTCVVPRLRGKTPRAARKSLAHADCTLGAMARMASGLKMRGRIVRQALPPGTVTASRSAVAVTIGKRP